MAKPLPEPKLLAAMGPPGASVDGVAIRIPFKDSEGQLYTIDMRPQTALEAVSQIYTAITVALRRAKTIDPAATIGQNVIDFSVGGSHRSNVVTLQLKLPSASADAFEFLLESAKARRLGQGLIVAADRLDGVGTSRN